ncbi:hypothetical protein CPB84DRAFT_1752339 [Gymnopilus junonius]|uniref:Uncharacterized protein n=1 Tax=Gymnopilus junonius TaxID=109634 RepID=A0A9P5THI0_GYMJU|nr:hypothetical protein CPB84DRAFT_1752339 [Gymnopilus junonius]
MTSGHPLLLYIQGLVLQGDGPPALADFEEDEGNFCAVRCDERLVLRAELEDVRYKFRGKPFIDVHSTPIGDPWPFDETDKMVLAHRSDHMLQLSVMEAPGGHPFLEMYDLIVRRTLDLSLSALWNLNWFYGNDTAMVVADKIQGEVATWDFHSPTSSLDVCIVSRAMLIQRLSPKGENTRIFFPAQFFRIKVNSSPYNAVHNWDPPVNLLKRSWHKPRYQ